MKLNSNCLSKIKPERKEAIYYSDFWCLNCAEYTCNALAKEYSGFQQMRHRYMSGFSTKVSQNPLYLCYLIATFTCITIA